MRLFQHWTAPSQSRIRQPCYLPDSLPVGFTETSIMCLEEVASWVHESLLNNRQFTTHTFGLPGWEITFLLVKQQVKSIYYHWFMSDL